jgi:4-deoxy-L-threo-5-hexosulose-uronate ketol-isomerase
MMKMLQVADKVRFRTMTTQELRDTFLLTDLFQPEEISLTYVDIERIVIGSAVPISTPLLLPTYDSLRAAYFTERRELGILNIGGQGSVTVNDQTFTLQNLDGLYIGRGNEHIQLESTDPDKPAELYLLSYPAHAAHPTRYVRSNEQEKTSLGATETANRREIIKLIYPAAIQSCQLVMGFTQLATGSVWNTMPPHTHMRRSEIYLYFNLPLKERILHLMGPPQETRNLIVANKEAVISPAWSIHAGAGTTSYSFCWGMGGENQAYDDMDPVAIADLR